jgi:hypothetical protein
MSEARQLVLGLSLTSEAVRWVLVEGVTGDGATIDRGACESTVDIDELLDVLLVNDGHLHAIGVTWTDRADEAASGILAALTARGYADVIAVSVAEAADLLATGIAEIADYATAAVCIIEPDEAVVALVDNGAATVDRIDRPRDGADAVELPSAILSTLELTDRQPDAVFVLGSAADLDVLVHTIDDVTETSVFSAADAGLALARGAALASAAAVNSLAPVPLRLPTRTAALVATLAAACVTFVVSLAAAVGLGFPSATDTEEPQAADAVEAPAPPPPSTQAAIKARLTRSLAEARPLVAQTMVVALPPAPEVAPPADPIEAPPAAPPPPVYVPPAPPVYVPPAPKPRLRDRIIERIPLINRFHEPQYQYGP